MGFLKQTQRCHLPCTWFHYLIATQIISERVNTCTWTSRPHYYAVWCCWKSLPNLLDNPYWNTHQRQPSILVSPVQEHCALFIISIDNITVSHSWHASRTAVESSQLTHRSRWLAAVLEEPEDLITGKKKKKVAVDVLQYRVGLPR